MSDLKDRLASAGGKRRRQLVFTVGFIVAAIPILCQFLMLGALSAAPEAFPSADRTFTEARFWPIQVVLLCVAVAGTAIVDCVRMMLNGQPIDGTVVGYFLLLLLFFLIESMMFSVTLLASRIGWEWSMGMSVVGALNLSLAYMLEMEIGDSD
jgi:hypothetical protein